MNKNELKANRLLHELAEIGQQRLNEVNAGPDDKLQTFEYSGFFGFGRAILRFEYNKKTDDKTQNLINTAKEIISDFDNYGEVLQHGELSNCYDETSPIEILRKAVKEIEK